MIVGVSVEGRAIEAFDVAGSDDAPGLGALVFGAIHGDEPGSAELCRRFVAALAARAAALSHHRHSRRQPRRARRAASKNNARDVDLNRNFAARNWTREHAPGYDPGPRPQSEPETVALATLIERWQPRALVAVHQPLRCVNWDGAGQGARRRRWPRRAATRRCASVGYPDAGLVRLALRRRRGALRHHARAAAPRPRRRLGRLPGGAAMRYNHPAGRMT